MNWFSFHNVTKKLMEVKFFLNTVGDFTFWLSLWLSLLAKTKH